MYFGKQFTPQKFKSSHATLLKVNFCADRFRGGGHCSDPGWKDNMLEMPEKFQHISQCYQTLPKPAHDY